MLKGLIGCVVFGCVLFCGQESDARPFRVNMLPNGNVNSCTNCHVSARGGGARTPFGEDVSRLVSRNGREVFWTGTLAAQDSDGDGFSNGQELGDPNGTGTPIAGAVVSNPGVATSVPPILNRPPVLGTIADQSVKEGKVLTFVVEATDEDNDTLTLSATGLPEGATFENGSITWIPGFEQEGTYEIIVTAHDGTESVTTMVSVTVEHVRRPMQLVGIEPARGTLFGEIGNTLRMTLTAISPDVDALSYVWTVNGETQMETGPSLLWTVSMGEADDQVQVSVSDGTDTFGQQWTVGKMLKGDFNGDRTVNFNDFLLFVQTFGKTSADLEFDAGIDLNGSGQIDFPDFLTFARYFGLSAP